MKEREREKNRRSFLAPLHTHTQKKNMHPSSSSLSPPPAAVGVPELASTARAAAFAEVSRLLQHPEHLRRLPQLLAEYEAKRKVKESKNIDASIAQSIKLGFRSFPSFPVLPRPLFLSLSKISSSFASTAPIRPTPPASPRPSGPRWTQPGPRRRCWPRPLPPSPGSASATRLELFFFSRFQRVFARFSSLGAFLFRPQACSRARP